MYSVEVISQNISKNYFFLFELLFYDSFSYFILRVLGDFPGLCQHRESQTEFWESETLKKVNQASGKTLLEYFPHLAMVRCN